MKKWKCFLLLEINTEREPVGTGPWSTMAHKFGVWGSLTGTVLASFFKFLCKCWCRCLFHLQVCCQFFLSQPEGLSTGLCAGARRSSGSLEAYILYSLSFIRVLGFFVQMLYWTGNWGVWGQVDSLACSSKLSVIVKESGSPTQTHVRVKWQNLMEIKL